MLEQSDWIYVPLILLFIIYFAWSTRPHNNTAPSSTNSFGENPTPNSNVPFSAQSSQFSGSPQNYRILNRTSQNNRGSFESRQEPSGYIYNQFGNDFKMDELSRFNKDYIFVSTKMERSNRSNGRYRILKIEKIWNRTVWKRYVQFRDRVKQESKPNEMKLFHGSTRCNEIVRNGFDERYSRTCGMFGAGVYFAENSNKSDTYTDRSGATRQMLLCRVTLGKVLELRSARNNLAHAPPGYNSVKGVASPGALNFSEYIVYRGEQAFPEYLITYTG